MRVHAPFFYIEENNGIASYACVVPLVFMRIFKQLGYQNYFFVFSENLINFYTRLAKLN